MNDLNQNKIEKMWKKIMDYERGDGMIDGDRAAVENIMKIIDEVYKECY